MRDKRFPIRNMEIGYIPQDIFILDDTLENNILFFREHDEEKLQEAIRQSHLNEVIDQLPYGVNTILGERGVRLSGGQNQRVGIARALYSKPDLFMLDEATSSLDNMLEKEIMKDIYALRGERTIIIAAHRLSTLDGCDRIYSINRGHLKEEA